MSFRLASRLMTLDHFELGKTSYFRAKCVNLGNGRIYVQTTKFLLMMKFIH